MNMKDYLDKLMNIQQNLIEYIDDEDVADKEHKFDNFKDLISKNKIQDNQQELKLFLYLLTKISKNHHRQENFFNKIGQILSYLKDDMKKYFSNSELFDLFKSNKRILLFLIEYKILNFDGFIAKQIIKSEYIKKKYPEYFQPEIQPFLQSNWFPKNTQNKWILEIQKELPENFYERRKNGENDNFICELIRKDLLDDFIVYINENNYKLDSIINQSKYETNNFLNKKKNKKTTLIEYAAFFGSIRIFKYLILKDISLTPTVWLYAIHGNNPEILEVLEENNIELLSDKLYKKILKESIKCHHNDISYYIQNNYRQNESENSNFELIKCLKYYNFTLITYDKINETSINYLCKYDYYTLFNILINTNDIDLNKKTI